MTSEDNYYDHYKDSFEQQKSHIAKRDHYTIALMAMVALLCLHTIDPNLVNNGINSFLRDQIKIESVIKFDWRYINTALSFIFLWMTLQYYSVCLTIENSYKYIHKIEEKISAKGDFSIYREGKSYLKCYPWLKEFSNWIFVFIFPILFITISSLNAYVEINSMMQYDANILQIISATGYILNIILSLLYLSNRLLHEEAFSKEEYPALTGWERFLAYLGIKKLPKTE